MSAPTLSDIVALLNVSKAACIAYDRAVNDALLSDFPRHPTTDDPGRSWGVRGGVALHVWFGLDDDDDDNEGAWVAGSYIGGRCLSRATGPTPYAAINAALYALDDTEARDALRAAVEATR